MAATKKKAEAVNNKLAEEKAELAAILEKGDTAVKEMEDKARKVESEKKALDVKVSSEEQFPPLRRECGILCPEY